MAHTDKDRPFWVIRHVEGFTIDHDHRSGRCIEETMDYARITNAGAYKRGYRHDCLKRIEHEYHCTEDSPFSRTFYSWRDREVRRRSPGQFECWGTWKEPVWAYAGAEMTFGNHFAYRTKKNGCLGPHKRVEYVDEIPCVCNGWPPVPTCDPSWHGAELGYRYSHYATTGKSKSEWCRVAWHGPERRRERDTLRGQVKEYNAGGDLDDWDYLNRQGRRSVHWEMY